MLFTTGSEYLIKHMDLDETTTNVCPCICMYVCHKYTLDAVHVHVYMVVCVFF